MARKLCLHIGAQKTGTTSIQAALSDSRARLAALGWCYPEVEWGDPNKVSHYNSFRGFFSSGEPTRAATDRFIRRARREPGSLILSAECLSAWPPRTPGRKLHDLWAEKHRIVARIREQFPNHEATVILYTRAAPDFLRSLYGQYLKMTGKPDNAQNYDTFLCQEGHLADFASEAAAWRSAFEHVVTVDYGSITSSVQAFCDIVGLPQLDDRRENVSVAC